MILYGEGANLEGESAMIFKMLGNTHSVTQCLIPGAVKLQQDCCANLRLYKLQVALLSLGLTLHCAVISVTVKPLSVVPICAIFPHLFFIYSALQKFILINNVKNIGCVILQNVVFLSFRTLGHALQYSRNDSVLGKKK